MLAESGQRRQHISVSPTAYNAHTEHPGVNIKPIARKVNITCLSSQLGDDALALLRGLGVDHGRARPGLQLCIYQPGRHQIHRALSR